MVLTFFLRIQLLGACCIRENRLDKIHKMCSTHLKSNDICERQQVCLLYIESYVLLDMYEEVKAINTYGVRT